jgi:hypothetical protein
MSTDESISREAVAADLETMIRGKVKDTDVDAALSSILTATTKYPAAGSIVSLIFYIEIQLQVKIPDGKTFNGKAGAITTPGAGALIGDVYTDDLGRLYRDTVSFAFTAVPAYTNVFFFDANSTLLGHFHGGAVSIVFGLPGGGTGRWS